MAEPGRPRSALAHRLGLLAVLAAPAATQPQVVERYLDDVRLRVSTPWPTDVVTGWMPFEMTVDNPRDEAVQVHFRMSQGWADSTSASGTVELEPGESRTLSWLMLVRKTSGLGNDLGMLIGLGYLGAPHHGEPGLEAADFRFWASGAGTSFSASVFDDAGGTSLGSGFSLIAVADAAVPAVAHELGLASEAGRTARPDIVGHGDLSTDWRAYSSLARLILDLRAGMPDEAVRLAVLAWVRAGGVLQVVATEPTPWLPLESRFRAGTGPWPAPLAPFRHGFGSIQVSDTVRERDSVNWLESHPSLSREPYEHLAPGAVPLEVAVLETPIPGLRTVPLGLLTLVLTVFFLAMGPVQFTWLKRSRAPPSRLLISAPALGLGFAVLLLVVSLVHQGLSVKQAVTSLTWLDQGRHQAATLAKRTVFSGSVFGTELRYGGDSLVVPLQDVSGGGDTPGLQIDLATGALGGAFLPVRAPASELLVSSTNARQRLALESGPDGLTVLNGLDARIEELLLRTHDGATYVLADGVLAAGERGRLKAVPLRGRLVFRSWVPGAEDGASQPALLTLEPAQAHLPGLGHVPDMLPAGSYAARLATSPFIADGGVPRTTVAQRHLLIGDLGPAP